MQWIRYLFNNPGEDEDGSPQDNLFEKSLPYSEEAIQIAQEESYNGEYTVEDDGQADPIAPMEETVSWDELAAAIREGVNEA